MDKPAQEAGDMATRDEMHTLASRVAAEYGCELQPAAYGGVALVVQRRNQGSDDTRKLRVCREALARAGVDTSRLLS
jgi:hypothetical protein